MGWWRTATGSLTAWEHVVGADLGTRPDWTGRGVGSALGSGWAGVEPEFRALNENFTDRGRRIQEQIAVLRALFTQEVVTFRGRWHDLDAIGIAPLPTRPIPIWIGGQADAALRRAAALGAGFSVQKHFARHRAVQESRRRSTTIAAPADPSSQAGVVLQPATGQPGRWRPRSAGPSRGCHR